MFVLLLQYMEKKFESNNEKKFTQLFEECKKTKNLVFHSFLENKKIIQLFQKMHIFSYPSIWQETSCIYL